MKDIGKIKRSVTLTNEQWRAVSMCILHEQVGHMQEREYWERESCEKTGNAEMNVAHFDKMIQELEEIRMTIG